MLAGYSEDASLRRLAGRLANISLFLSLKTIAKLLVYTYLRLDYLKIYLYMFDSLNYGETVMTILNQWFQVVVYQVKSQIVFYLRLFALADIHWLRVK